jgi:hypothetical protein
MNVKQKQGGQQARRVAQEKEIPVAEGSQQSRGPGAGAAQRGSEQSAGIAGASGGNQQGGPQAGERGGPGTQQAGWSSRQQAERIKARGEEARQGKPQQSGYGGAEQDQHAGSKESPTGKRGGSGGAGETER